MIGEFPLEVIPTDLNFDFISNQRISKEILLKNKTENEICYKLRSNS